MRKWLLRLVYAGLVLAPIAGYANYQLGQCTVSCTGFASAVVATIHYAQVMLTDATGVDVSDTTNHAIKVNVVAGGAGGGIVTQATGTNLHTVVDSATGTAEASTASGTTFSILGADAVTAEKTAVANGQNGRLVTDLVGKLIVLPYANPENFETGVTAAITDTTSTAVIASAGGALRHYITSCKVTNSHATVGTYVQILDGSTVVDSGFAAPVGGGWSTTYPTPLRGTAATALNCQATTTGSNFKCSCQGYKGI